MEITKELMYHAVLGTDGPSGGYSRLHLFKHVGELRGFPNESWHWNTTFLKNLSLESLIALYNDLIEPEQNKALS